MHFAVESVLDTHESNIINLLGSASGIIHKVSGTIHLHVQKTVQLKQLTVAFVGEACVRYDSAIVSAQSDPVPLYRTEFNALEASAPVAPPVGPSTSSLFSPASTPKTFNPGDYSFPFQLQVPSDLAATESTKLQSNLLFWAYELITTAVPSSLFQKRKTAYQPVKLRKVLVQPSTMSLDDDVAYAYFSTKRGDEFETSIHIPKVVNICQENGQAFPLVVQLKPREGYADDYQVKEIQAVAVQTEKIVFDSKNAIKDMTGIRHMIPNAIATDPMARGKYRDESKPLINSFNTRLISNTATIPVPAANNAVSCHSFNIELVPKDSLLPSETLPWIQISHAIKFTILFTNATKKPLVVKAPFQLGYVISGDQYPTPRSSGAENVVTNQLLTEGSAGLPRYGDDINRSTLLDSNLSGARAAASWHAFHQTAEDDVVEVSNAHDYEPPPEYNFQSQDTAIGFSASEK
ncbi:hypothetical protein BGX28_009702 [Mortierella sp. GBA30]|nr:hypothetical protein BGX28_009702 [Mortierella sp. GBA30]